MSSLVNNPTQCVSERTTFCALNNCFTLIYCTIDCTIITVIFWAQRMQCRLINHVIKIQYAFVVSKFKDQQGRIMCVWTSVLVLGPSWEVILIFGSMDVDVHKTTPSGTYVPLGIKIWINQRLWIFIFI